MTNSRIEAIFEGMEAPKLREHLNKLCNHGKFAIEDPMGKIEIDGRNIIISKGFVDLTRDDDSDVEEEKEETEDGSERGELSQKEDEDDVPALTKQQIEQLIASKKRNLPIFKCEDCKKEFDVHKNGKGDCWYHSGIKDVDHDSDFWADHDDDAHGDPRLLKMTLILLKVLSGIVVSNWEVRRVVSILGIKRQKKEVVKEPDIEI